ncbi:unnamed protein product [Rangifer tarandus platyrhynchus]|uniref:Uncharacterized protein n=2 Tax=Rangifer tarandus platyrhynchus TaxID=3082113 RepID=A0ACB0E6J5_RANTA|nr:unnamed protein product [Rangifer tarandus platyrhynchus]CAI9695886.1 unnamed protein product [Rangifer tarandus platyrhynchus]
MAPECQPQMPPWASLRPELFRKGKGDSGKRKKLRGEREGKETDTALNLLSKRSLSHPGAMPLARGTGIQPLAELTAAATWARGGHQDQSLPNTSPHCPRSLLAAQRAASQSSSAGDGSDRTEGLVSLGDLDSVDSGHAESGCAA